MARHSFEAATINDVAIAAGVSPATAARALGGYGSVRPSTAERVQAAAERVGYRPNALARSMMTGRTRTIGVVLSDIENSFFVRALRGITTRAREDGYELMLANTDEDLDTERNAVALLVSRRVDGIIACPIDPSDVGHLEGLREHGIPLVLLDRSAPRLRADTVGIDNVAAGQEATGVLLAAGHTRIGMLSGVSPDATLSAFAPERSADATPTMDRVRGYCLALRTAGLTPDVRLVSSGGIHLDEAADAAVAMLSRPEAPTAIIASDSLQTLGALQALQRLGLSAPEDVSIVGFDNAEWAQVVDPPMTVIEQPAEEIGRSAMRFLSERIDEATDEPRDLRMPVRLIPRESVGPPREGPAPLARVGGQPGAGD